MKTLPRVFEFWCARQGTGKTTALRSRVRSLAKMRSVVSVWVFDRLNEWVPKSLGLNSVEVVRSIAQYLSLDCIPRVVIWQLGRHVSQYVRPMVEAVELGDVVVVIDEAYEYAPTGARWTGPEILRDIVLAGRHLPRADGAIRPTHLIVATQYPRTVHHLVWSQAYCVMVGLTSGEQTAAWLRDNYGDKALETARALKPYQWAAVHGEKPPMPGYGVNG